MSDSTNSGVPGFSISEKKVAAALLDQMRRTPGRLLVSTFASNVLRLNQILEAAVACGRKVAVFGRSMENVCEIGKNMFPQPGADFRKPAAGQQSIHIQLPPHRLIELCSIGAAERIRRKVSERRIRPVRILENAVSIIRHIDAEILLHFLIP